MIRQEEAVTVATQLVLLSLARTLLRRCFILCKQLPWSNRRFTEIAADLWYRDL
jgi:hypothetical protein